MHSLERGVAPSRPMEATYPLRGNFGHLPDAVAPPAGHSRFEGLDGLRAIAAISVLAYHAAIATSANQLSGIGWITSRLNIGVTVFFLLSGFLLYRPFVAVRWESRPAPGLGTFYWRRALRILPAYWVALTAVAAIPLLAHSSFAYTRILSSDWYAYYGFLQVYSVHTVALGFGHAWTLCVEASFYLLLPLLALCAARMQRADSSDVLELVALGVLACASIAFGAYIHTQGPASYHLSLTLPGTFYWFALGMALATLSVGSDRTRLGAGARALAERASVCWLLALSLFLVLARFGGLPHGDARPLSSLRFMEEHLSFGAISLLMVMPAALGTRRTSIVHRLLTIRPLKWLGLVSYGLYLWHLPVILALDRAGAPRWFPVHPFPLFAGLALMISLPLAATSYYLVEAPFLRLKHRHPREFRAWLSSVSR